MLFSKSGKKGEDKSEIMEIFAYSNKRKAEIGDENVFDFSIGNPSIRAPKQVDDTIIDLIKNVDSVSLHGYTTPAGRGEVLETLAKSIRERYNTPCEKENLYITCGAAASLSISLKALIKKGQEVILLAPYFPEYTAYLENAGAKVREVLCERKTFGIDLTALEKAINKKTRVVIVNSPNNPTGVIYSEQNIKDLAALLERKQKKFGTKITIIADEPYRELCYDDNAVPFIPCFYDNTIVCYSYSKSLSIPGERIGYLFVSPKMQDAKQTYNEICKSARGMGYICAPTLLQRVIAECNDIRPDLSKYDENRKMLYNAITDIGYEAVMPQGAFYLFVKALEDDAKEFCKKARKYELLFVPSDSFGVKGYVRIAYCVSKSQIENSISAFEKLYKEYAKEK